MSPNAGMASNGAGGRDCSEAGPPVGTVVQRPVEGAVLLLSVFVAASSGLAYELVIGTTGAYLAGDGVREFSLTIGIFLFAMGVGSFLSRSVQERVLEAFILVEVTAGLLGGFSNAILFLVYSFLSGYQVVMYGLLFLVGVFIGLEIPLLVRLLSAFKPLRVNISNVLSLDYVGSLVAAVLFPLVLLPNLGLMQTALLFGILNVLVGLGNYLFFRRRQGLGPWLGAASVAALGLLVAGFLWSDRIVALAESRQYDDEIILVEQTPYQRIVLTRWRDDLRMFLNGDLQFSSRDEYRYHEVLVHPLLSTVARRDHVLILGGGDGLALREVLKYRDVRHVTLVDLDRRLVELCRRNPHIRRLNMGSLDSPKVRLVFQDAFTFVRGDRNFYDAAILDFPDPSNERLAKLYTLEFYRMVAARLVTGGGLAVQSASPYFTRRAFWSIVRTLEEAGLQVTPMRVQVPSFGEWGINLASRQKLPFRRARIRVPTRFLTQELLPLLFTFPRDMARVPVAVSTLDKPTVVYEYDRAWREYFK